jgi:hypothetical protein
MSGSNNFLIIHIIFSALLLLILRVIFHTLSAAAESLQWKNCCWGCKSVKYEAISEIEKSSFLLISTSLLHQVAIVIFSTHFHSLPTAVTAKGNTRGCSSGKSHFHYLA